MCKLLETLKVLAKLCLSFESRCLQEVLGSVPMLGMMPTRLIINQIKSPLFEWFCYSKGCRPDLNGTYSGDLNTDNLNTGNIGIPTFLKFKFQKVWYSNGQFMSMSYLLDQPFEYWTCT